MTWESHSFVDGERLKARDLRYIYDNLQELKFPRAEYKRMPEGILSTSSTTAASFVSVASMTVTLYCTGRWLLWTANVAAYTSAGDTEGQLDLNMDGVSISGGLGLTTVNWNDQPCNYPLTYYILPPAEGEHVFQLTHRRVSGTGTMETYRFSKHWMYVTEI